MQLTEQVRIDLIRRQKAYEAAVKAHELIEEANELLGTVCCEAHQGSFAYDMADKMGEKLKALESEALDLCSDIFRLNSVVLNAEIVIRQIKKNELY